MTNFMVDCHSSVLLSLFFPPDFSILYIHCFVYTVYDDFSGQQSNPGGTGQDDAHYNTNNTATETDTGGALQSVINCISFHGILLLTIEFYQWMLKC